MVLTIPAVWCACVVGAMLLTAMLAFTVGAGAVIAPAIAMAMAGVGFVCVVTLKPWWQEHDATLRRDRALATFALGSAFAGGCVGAMLFIRDAHGEIPLSSLTLFLCVFPAWAFAYTAYDAYTETYHPVVEWARWIAAKGLCAVLTITSAGLLLVFPGSMLIAVPFTALAVIALFAKRVPAHPPAHAA